MNAITLLAPRPDRPAQERINVVRFLAWSQTLEDRERALTAATLARAYLAGRFCLRLRNSAKASAVCRLEALIRDADACLAALTQNPSTTVRRAIAETFAREPEAPRHLIVALVNDEPCVAYAIARHSPVLTDIELAQLAADGAEAIQVAVAQRPRLSVCVTDSLVENGGPEVVIALLVNREARLAPSTLRCIATRFNGDAVVREALLTRRELPASVRYDIVCASLKHLESHCLRSEALRRRFERVANSLRDRDILRISASLRPTENRDLARHLRDKRTLTAGLLLRSLVSGNHAFFGAAAAVLSGLEPQRVAAFIRDYRGAGFVAVYRRMGLPMHYLRPMQIALAASDELGGADTGLVSRSAVSRLIENCESASSAPRFLIAFFRSLESEAVLDDGHILLQLAAAHNAEQLDADPSHEALATEYEQSALEQLQHPITDDRGICFPYVKYHAVA